jgi:predicted nucleic acid-binding protein
MSAEHAVIDTNVLVYAHFPSSPHHAASYDLLRRAERGEIGLAIVPQVVAEFVSVVTNPKRVSPPKSIEEAVEAVHRVMAIPNVVLLPFPEKATQTFLSLLLTHPATGPEIFDRQIAAVMIEYGIQTVYTFNVRDFANIPDVMPREPPTPAALPPNG